MIAFVSYASNLIDPPDMNGLPDLYVRDMTSGIIKRVSTSMTGGDANRYTGSGSISGNGRYVVFDTTASNIIAGDDAYSSDVFIRDLQTDTTERVATNATTVGASGGPGESSVSRDGRYVAYNRVVDDPTTGEEYGIYVYDRQATTSTRVSVNAIGLDPTGPIEGGTVGEASLSDDGRYIAFTSRSDLVGGDSGTTRDVFVRATIIPRVDSVTPATLYAGQSEHITITGADFPPDAGVQALTLSTKVIAIGTVTSVTPTSIEATITIQGDPGEIAYIGVTAPGPGPGVFDAGSVGTCTNNCPVLSG
jgi:Tol biopolymer transport system component